MRGAAHARDVQNKVCTNARKFCVRCVVEHVERDARDRDGPLEVHEDLRKPRVAKRRQRLVIERLGVAGTNPRARLAVVGKRERLTREAHVEPLEKRELHHRPRAEAAKAVRRRHHRRLDPEKRRRLAPPCRHDGRESAQHLAATLRLKQFSRPKRRRPPVPQLAQADLEGSPFHRSGKVYRKRKRLADRPGVAQNAAQQKRRDPSAERPDPIPIRRIGLGRVDSFTRASQPGIIIQAHRPSRTDWTAMRRTRASSAPRRRSRAGCPR